MKYITSGRNQLNVSFTNKEAHQIAAITTYIDQLYPKLDEVLLEFSPEYAREQAAFWKAIADDASRASVNAESFPQLKYKILDRTPDGVTLSVQSADSVLYLGNSLMYSCYDGIPDRQRLGISLQDCKGLTEVFFDIIMDDLSGLGDGSVPTKKQVRSHNGEPLSDANNMHEALKVKMKSSQQNPFFYMQYAGEMRKAFALMGAIPIDFIPIYTVEHHGLPEITGNGFDFSKIRPDIAVQEEAVKQEAVRPKQALKEAVAQHEAVFKEQIYQEALARGADEESARKSAEERAVLAQQQKEIAAAETQLSEKNRFAQVQDVMRKKEELREAQIAQAKLEAEREKRQYQGEEPLNKFAREAKINCDTFDKKSQMNLDWDAQNRKLSEEQVRRAQEKRDKTAELRREAAMREAAERQRRLDMNEDPYYSRSRGPRM